MAKFCKILTARSRSTEKLENMNNSKEYIQIIPFGITTNYLNWNIHIHLKNFSGIFDCHNNFIDFRQYTVLLYCRALIPKNFGLHFYFFNDYHPPKIKMGPKEFDAIKVQLPNFCLFYFYFHRRRRTQKRFVGINHLITFLLFTLRLSAFTNKIKNFL